MKRSSFWQVMAHSALLAGIWPSNAVRADDTASLQKLAAQNKLTPDQQEAIKEVLEQLKAKLAETVNKPAGDAQKMMTDLQKSIQR